MDTAICNLLNMTAPAVSKPLAVYSVEKFAQKGINCDCLEAFFMAVQMDVDLNYPEYQFQCWKRGTDGVTECWVVLK